MHTQHPQLKGFQVVKNTPVGRGSNLLFSKKQWLDGAALAAIKASERTIAAKAAPTGLTHYPPVIITNTEQQLELSCVDKAI